MMTKEDWAARRAELDRLFLTAFPTVLNVGKWTGTKGGRCITDYVRTIKFKEPPNEHLIRNVTSWLSENDSPGWTPIWRRAVDETSYIFGTTWDSSD